jgi:hypothetical protein
MQESLLTKEQPFQIVEALFRAGRIVRPWPLPEGAKFCPGALCAPICTPLETLPPTVLGSEKCTVPGPYRQGLGLLSVVLTCKGLGLLPADHRIPENCLVRCARCTGFTRPCEPVRVRVAIVSPTGAKPVRRANRPNRQRRERQDQPAPELRRRLQSLD